MVGLQFSYKHSCDVKSYVTSLSSENVFFIVTLREAAKPQSNCMPPLPCSTLSFTLIP